MIDRFGKDTMLVPDGEHFRFTIQVSVSDQFLGWVISFGTQIRILSPDFVVEQMKELLSRTGMLYT